LLNFAPIISALDGALKLLPEVNACGLVQVVFVDKLVQGDARVRVLVHFPRKHLLEVHNAYNFKINNLTLLGNWVLIGLLIIGIFNVLLA
jgi:hypothetical protein